MTPLSAQPSPELGLDLVRDAVDIRRLPRWDPRYWGHVELDDEPRCSARFRTLGLSWAKARATARAEARTVPLAAERLAHELDCARQLAERELRREADHAIARESECAVPAPIGAAPTGVIAAIDLDDEAGRWGTEINDEGAEHDLALEADAELTGANGLPEALFGRRESRAQCVSAGREQLRASDIERAFFQGSLLVPAKWPGVAPLSAGSVTRARRIAPEVPARGAERAPRAARPLRRDEVRDEQRSIHSPRVSLFEESPAQQIAESLQARLRLAGAVSQRDYLPHSRAARAGVPQLAVVIHASRIGAGEHEFGEGRAPAGGVAAEDARVGAAHDESDERIVKMMTDASDQVTTTLYPYETLEVRGTVLDSGESTLSSANEVPYLVVHGVRLARLHYEQPSIGEPRVGGKALHVLFDLGDHLGSTSVVLDRETSELVEASTYQGYGAKESDYRPGRWKGFREDYGFTGKEDDSEFGVVYFGKRFYSLYLNRWLTADPLAVHVPGAADTNLYAYVNGRPLFAVDVLGLQSSGQGGSSGVSEETTSQTGADIAGQTAAKAPEGTSTNASTTTLFQVSSFPDKVRAEFGKAMSRCTNGLCKASGAVSLAVSEAGIFPLEIANVGNSAVRMVLSLEEGKPGSALGNGLSVAASVGFTLRSFRVLAELRAPKFTPLRGPVTFQPMPNATPAQIENMRLACELCNEAMAEGGWLSETGRVSPSAELERLSSNARAAIRAQAKRAGDTSYNGMHVGHIPDSTWSGRPDSFKWAPLDPSVNMSMGAQSARYPIGYMPTKFVLKLREVKPL